MIWRRTGSKRPARTKKRRRMKRMKRMKKRSLNPRLLNLRSRTRRSMDLRSRNLRSMNLGFHCPLLEVSRRRKALKSPASSTTCQKWRFSGPKTRRLLLLQRTALMTFPKR